MADDEEEWTINEKRVSLETVVESDDDFDEKLARKSASKPVKEAENTKPIQTSASFDPYNAENERKEVAKQSLLDEEEEDEPFVSPVKSGSIPGVAGFLEIEEEPPRENYTSPYNPVRTSSGLLLTHRKATPATKDRISDDYLDKDDKKKAGQSSFAPFRSPGIKRALQSIEVENPWSADQDPFQTQIMRMLSYTRLGVLISAVALIIGSSALLHHMRSPTSSSTEKTESTQQSNQFVSKQEDTVILLPMPLDQQQELDQQHRHLKDLRGEFQEWATAYGKVYRDEIEKEKRYQIWVANHHRTMKKNEQHGPCRMTKQPVFGSTHFKDLTPEEFKQNFLTGYSGPRHEEFKKRKSRSAGVLGPHIEPNHHPEMQRRMQSSWSRKGPVRGKYRYNCKWYDASCNLQYIYDRYFYGFGTTMEPAYDANSYPQSIDWRDAGAVSEVRSQGQCGACWAITAVQTVESAVCLKKGTLYDLSETEVIVCTEDSEMCYGGWPQDAFEYVIDNKGIPLEDDMPYNADFLLALSDTANGNGYQYSNSYLSSYKSSICPNSKEGSHDSNDANQADGDYSFASNTYSRYGKIDGYGYATDRCACYTDGSGCDCDSQDESMAVRNVATYGPATVCVDASLWQDYTGGIITSASGCSQKFMDVNHCVQVVGYAYTDGSNADDVEEEGSHDNHSGDQEDSGNRQGYWIVKNQWGIYWGYSGYAYVAMGENTCGILNDVVQVYA